MTAPTEVPIWLDPSTIRIRLDDGTSRHVQVTRLRRDDEVALEIVHADDVEDFEGEVGCWLELAPLESVLLWESPSHRWPGAKDEMTTVIGPIPKPRKVE